MYPYSQGSSTNDVGKMRNLSIIGTYTRILILALMSSCGLILLGPEPGIAQTGGIQAVCTQARDMIVNDPQAALDFIGQIRSGVPAALPEPVPSSTAAQIADVSQACESERLDALAAAGNKVVAPDQPSPPAQFQAFWEGIDKNFISLLQGIIFLVFIASALVVARLAAFLPSMAGEHTNPRDQTKLLWSGLILLIAAAGILVTNVQYTTDSATSVRETALLAVGFAIILVIVSTALIARSLAARLRMNITVHDAEGKTSSIGSGQLVAMLSELGGKASAGVEIPYATDVSALSEAALVTTPDQKIVALLHQLLQFVFNATPWSVLVDGNEETMSVIISRNGRTIDSVLISRADLELQHQVGLLDRPESGTKPLLTKMNKMAAALILTTLAEKHDGFEGLCGAKNWRSVGLQYIATTDYGGDSKDAVPLLAKAMEYDPGNRAADLALHHARYRNSGGRDDLCNYVKWLKEQELYTRLNPTSDSSISTREEGVTTRPGFLDLRRRLLINYVIAVLNLRSIPGCELSEPLAPELAALLVNLLRTNDRSPDSLAEEMRPLAHQLAEELRKQEASKAVGQYMDPVPKSAQAETSSPRLAYNAACSAAQVFRHESQTAEKEVARLLCLELLRTAVILPEYKDWAREDPSLQPLHGDNDFGALIGVDPRKDFWDITPLKPYQKLLVDAGVPRPSMLVTLVNERPYLRRYLGLDTAKLNRLLNISRLICHLEQHRHFEEPSNSSERNDFSAFKVEIVEAILAQGIERPEELANIGDVADRMIATVVKRCLRGPCKLDVENWLREWRQTASPHIVAKLQWATSLMPFIRS